jgi:hypothetical protein
MNLKYVLCQIQPNTCKLHFGLLLLGDWFVTPSSLAHPDAVGTGGVHSSNLRGLIAELDRAMQFPGISNAWTMPIKARIDMLSTSIRTPIGIKVFGKDLAEMERLAKEIETVVKDVPGTSSAFADAYIVDAVKHRNV